MKEGSNIVTHVGKLSITYLAGSERALATDLRTVRSLEGSNINCSLCGDWANAITGVPSVMTVRKQIAAHLRHSLKLNGEEAEQGDVEKK